MSQDTVVIYHNPNCGTSRNTLAMIRNAGGRTHRDRVSREPAFKEDGEVAVNAEGKRVG